MGRSSMGARPKQSHIAALMTTGVRRWSASASSTHLPRRGLIR